MLPWQEGFLAAAPSVDGTMLGTAGALDTLEGLRGAGAGVRTMDRWAHAWRAIHTSMIRIRRIVAHISRRPDEPWLERHIRSWRRLPDMIASEGKRSMGHQAAKRWVAWTALDTRCAVAQALLLRSRLFGEQVQAWPAKTSRRQVGRRPCGCRDGPTKHEASPPSSLLCPMRWRHSRAGVPCHLFCACLSVSAGAAVFHSETGRCGHCGLHGTVERWQGVPPLLRLRPGARGIDHTLRQGLARPRLRAPGAGISASKPGAGCCPRASGTPVSVADGWCPRRPTPAGRASPATRARPCRPEPMAPRTAAAIRIRPQAARTHRHM